MSAVNVTVEQTIEQVTVAVTETLETVMIVVSSNGGGGGGGGGVAATVSVGTTTTGEAGTDASVSNSGTTAAAVLNFTIPRGVAGGGGGVGGSSVINTDGDLGKAIYVGAIDPDDNYTLVTGDIWIQIPL